MKKLIHFFGLLVLMLTSTTVAAQPDDSPFYRYDLQFNIAGLGFERWGLAYEWRMTPQHALFFQGGGTFPYLSEEKEYGLGLHYKYFLKPVSHAKLLWVFKPAYHNTFADLNVRYMNLDGIHEDASFLYDAYFVGLGVGQTWIWHSGFLVSYWIGYGPPLGAEFTWKNTVPDGGDSWATTYKNASGMDFGLALGYAFGRK